MASQSELADTARKAFHAGDLPRAELACRELLQLNPGRVPALHMLATVLHRLGRHHEAILSLQKAVQLEPLNANWHSDLGMVCAAAGKVDEAVSQFREALRLNPDHADSHTHLGIVLAQHGDRTEALTHLREALRLQPDSAAAHTNLGFALADRGCSGEAEQHYRQALSLQPNCAATWTNLAVVLLEANCTEEAVACCQEALRLDPDSTESHACLGQLAAQGLYHFTEDQIRGIQGQLATGRLSCDAASRLHFVLAGFFDRQADHDRAFVHYRQANDLQAQLLRQKNRLFDPARHQRFIGDVIATLDRTFVERVRSFGLDTEVPVLVVGMPRTGTTLVAQILSSHPQVASAGELRDLGEIFKDPPADGGEDGGEDGGADAYPRALLRLDQATARALAGRYLDRLSRLGPGAARVIDKMPHNYLRLGAVFALFPKARVIHCRRDARDVCLSSYFQNFAWIDYACSLEHLGLYYRQYERLMRHWQEVLPLQIYEVKYEELVAHQERISRELVDFCGLDWSDRCLAFHANARAVQTASSLQVRRPIYTTSVARWKRYEKHLLPLMQALGSVYCPGREETHEPEA